MGSFNQTCMISGLPITYRDKIRMILLSEHPRAVHGVHLMDASGKWIPRTFPVRGTYDDYGRIDIDPGSELMLNLMVRGLQEDLYELEVGENEHWDLAVKKDMGWDKLWDALWKERLVVHGIGIECDREQQTPRPTKIKDIKYGSFRPVHVRPEMIREDVWQYLLDTPMSPGWDNRPPPNLTGFEVKVKAYWLFCEELLKEAAEAEKLPREEHVSIFDEKSPVNARMHIQDPYRRIRDQRLSSVERLIRDELIFGLGSHWLMALEGMVDNSSWDHFINEVTEFLWIMKVGLFDWRPSESGGQDPMWREHLHFHKGLVKILERQVKKEDEG